MDSNLYPASDLCMRTRLVLDDVPGKTLTAVIQDALREHLQRPRRRGKGFRLKLLAKRGRLLPGVDLSDRDSLYERMEGRG